MNDITNVVENDIANGAVNGIMKDITYDLGLSDMRFTAYRLESHL